MTASLKSLIEAAASKVLVAGSVEAVGIFFAQDYVVHVTVMGSGLVSWLDVVTAAPLHPYQCPAAPNVGRVLTRLVENVGLKPDLQQKYA
jgi:hypothetical protein